MNNDFCAIWDIGETENMKLLMSKFPWSNNR